MDQPDVDLNIVREAFCSQFGVLPRDVTVVKHYPEDFFITFEHRHHRDAAVERRDFSYRNL